MIVSTRRFVAAVAAAFVAWSALYCAVPALGQKQPAPDSVEAKMLARRKAATNNKRIAFTFADPSAPVNVPELLRALGVVTAEALPVEGASPSTFGVGSRSITVHGGEGSSFNIELVEQSNGRAVAEWQVRLDDEQTARLAEAIKKAIAEHGGGGQLAPQERQTRVQALRKDRDAIRAKQSVLSALVRGQAETRKDGLSARLARLDAERERLEIDLTASQARAGALRRQMDELQHQSQVRAQEDEILAQLSRAIRAREEELKRAKDMAAQGLMPQSEVAIVEGRVGDAQIQFLTRKEALARGGDEKGDLLGRFANELAMISVDTAEKEARLKYIHDRLPQLDPRALNEKTLDEIAQQYPTLLSESGQLPPLYFELDKRNAESLKNELALIVSDVKLEAEPTTAPAAP